MNLFDKSMNFNILNEEIPMKNSKTKKTLLNVLIMTVFVVSALISSTLMFISVWGDLEASMFSATLKGDERLGSLDCPTILTTKEVGKVSAKFTNPMDRDIKPSVRVHISSGHLTLMREENVKFQLAPDKSKELYWSVEPEDATYGKMVLVKVFLFPNHPIPSKQGTCEIFVLDVPTFTGKQLVYSSMIISFLGMTGGVAGWRLNNPPMPNKSKEGFRTFAILAGTIIVGTIAGVQGIWLVGSLGIVITLLMIVNSMAQALK